MSSSHQSTIMSLEQAKMNYRNMVTKYLTSFQISQIVSGKGSIRIAPAGKKYAARSGKLEENGETGEKHLKGQGDVRMMSEWFYTFKHSNRHNIIIIMNMLHCCFYVMYPRTNLIFFFSFFPLYFFCILYIYKHVSNCLCILHMYLIILFI